MPAPERTHRIRGRRFLLRVEDSADARDYLKYEAVRNEVWVYPEDAMSGARNLMCENFLHEGSTLFIGAFAEDARGTLVPDLDHMAGFSYGFVGIEDKSRGFGAADNLWFYSQYTAVRPGFEGAGLGVLIKEFQRAVLLEALGIGRVVCTYDPLTAVNARRNVHHFRMDVREYRPATYGEYGGRLNRADVPTDRFFMSWDLRADPRRKAAEAGAPPAPAGRVIESAERTMEGRSGTVRLETVTGYDPEAADEWALVRVPADFYRMLRETDVADPSVRRVPVDWRTVTRRAFLDLLERGYRVVDFLSGDTSAPGCYYALRRTAR